jgi:hypothetical protein
VKIVRVFPRKTKFTPIDETAFVGDPPLFRPDAAEVHISVSFTWDLKEAYRLKEAWEKYYPVVKLGGPAIEGNQVGEFVPGRYIKPGVTITSRGCDRRCKWCLVPEREGDLRLLEIKPGWIIQDNNILATPREHQEKVYKMLRSVGRRATFLGGIDARLVDSWVVEELRNVSIRRLYLSADTKGSLTWLSKAVENLQDFGRERLSCYVLIGFNGETIEEAEERLKAVWSIGCFPYAMLYQPPDRHIEYGRDWNKLAKEWIRPQIIRARMLKNGLGS